MFSIAQQQQTSLSFRPLNSVSSTMKASTSRSSSMRFSRASAATTPTTTTVRVSADASAGGSKKDTTVEYQRVKAKEMVKYFKEQQYQQLVEDSTVFGFTKKNEINNGRWTMFGLLVGMMTEYATGVDFIDQIKLLVNVLGIADLD
jgi:hypothetical protein